MHGLPEGGDQGQRWHEIGEEIAAWSDWLAQIPPTDHVRIASAGMRYATHNGPYLAWLRFCEEALTGEIVDSERSDILWITVQVMLRGGLPDRAFAAAKEKRELDLSRGADREAGARRGGNRR